MMPVTGDSLGAAVKMVMVMKRRGRRKGRRRRRGRSRRTGRRRKGRRRS